VVYAASRSGVLVLATTNDSATSPRPLGTLPPLRTAYQASLDIAARLAAPTPATAALTPSALVAAELAFGLARLAVAAGFEPAEGCPSRAFEFCGWWFKPVRLGLVPPEPRLGSPLRTPLNLRE
jgi:hypothetical protein